MTEVNFYNLINARIERSSRSKKDKEKEIEKVDQLFHEEEIHESPSFTSHSPSLSGNIDLESIILGEDDTKKSPSLRSENNIEKYLQKELGKEFEDKDYFKEINAFDFLSLEKMPLKSQNRALRNEYLEIRGRLSEFNDEMNQKNGKLRTFSVEAERLKTQHKMMRDAIRSIASMLPDGTDLKYTLDTNNWNIEDVQDSLMESLGFVTNRVRNVEEYINQKLQEMEGTVAKYKQLYAMQENEKNLLSQELQNKNDSMKELKKEVQHLKTQLTTAHEQLQEARNQAIPQEVKETEEERIRREKLEKLRQYEQELMQLKSELEIPLQVTKDTLPAETTPPVSITPPAAAKPPVKEFVLEHELQPPVGVSPASGTKEGKKEQTPTPPLPEPVIAEPVIAAEEPSVPVIPELPSPSASDDLPPVLLTEEVIEEEEEEEMDAPEEVIEEEADVPEEEEESPSLDPLEDEFDIDAILERKLQIKNPDAPAKPSSTSPSSAETKKKPKELSVDDIVVPMNIDEHMRFMNDKKTFIIQIIGDYGFARNQEISNFIEKDAEGIRIFSSKGKFQKQEVTNITRGLADSEYLSVQRVDMGGRGGHNFKIYELTDMGKAIYKHLFNKAPVVPESQLLVEQHASLEHGYLIKETITEFLNMGYKVYTERKDCRYNLPNGEHKVFDLVIEKDGEKKMIEVERGTHKDTDFFKAMNKIYEITKDFYFVCPNDTVWFDKTRRQFYLWMKKEMGGAQDPKIKGVITLNSTTLGVLKKDPKPKSVWKTSTF